MGLGDIFRSRPQVQPGVDQETIQRHTDGINAAVRKVKSREAAGDDGGAKTAQDDVDRRIRRMDREVYGK